MNEYTTPLILTCNITGRKQKLYHRPYIDSLITKHGSLENLLKNYTAKGAKRKEGPKPTESNEPTQPSAKVIFNDIKPLPARVITVGEVDGEPQSCTVYENYDN